MPNFEQEKTDTQLLYLIRALYAEPFFRAQIAHIHVDKYKQVYLYPQIGKQTVEFGSLFDINNKLKKLKVFTMRYYPSKAGTPTSESTLNMTIKSSVSNYAKR
ncbi:MAG: hypothetical protein HC912_05180 [Saprospiraceae bacterium]|nr:hypothetical protein [Saprospiraceae bacterium]